MMTFDVDSIDVMSETLEQGYLRRFPTKLKALVREFIDVFVRRDFTAVEPVKIVIDEDKWRPSCNSAPPRKQVDALLELGLIKESQATEWSQFPSLLLKGNLRNDGSS
jgi:hypothetical protein